MSKTVHKLHKIQNNLIFSCEHTPTLDNLILIFGFVDAVTSDSYFCGYTLSYSIWHFYGYFHIVIVLAVTVVCVELATPILLGVCVFFSIIVPMKPCTISRIFQICMVYLKVNRAIHVFFLFCRFFCHFFIFLGFLYVTKQNLIFFLICCLFHESMKHAHIFSYQVPEAK